MAQICKGGTRQITKNFTESELYSKSLDAPNCHNVSDKTINGLQIIRDWFKTPIIVTSTLRTEVGNATIGGVSNSKHLTGSAIDSVFQKDREIYLKQFYDDFKCKGPLYRKLRQAGINGIGIYKTFIHIDDRANPSFWDDSAGEWGNTKITNSYMANIPESGLSSAECQQEAEVVKSDYGLTGVLAPLDPSNYSGEDGIKSQEQGIINLLIGGGLMVIGGIALIAYSRGRKKIV